MDNDTRLVVTRDVVARKVEDDVLLIDPETDRCFLLAGIKWEIWNSMALGITVGALRGRVDGEFGDGEFEGAWLPVIVELEAYGLVRRE